MKHALLLPLLLLLTGLTALAQFQQNDDFLLDSPDPSGTLQFSLNTTGLLSSIIGGSDANFDFLENHGNLFMLKVGNGRTFFRSGFNLAFEESQDAVFGQKERKHAYSAVLGIEGQRPIGRRFDWMVGYSFYGSFQSTRTETEDPFAGNTTLIRDDLELGMEFMLGVQYAISNRVHIFTESYFLAAATRDIQKSKFEFDPGFDNENVDKGSNFRLVAPTSIYLAISF